jgi:Zn-dependent metalloprotease
VLVALGLLWGFGHGSAPPEAERSGRFEAAPVQGAGAVVGTPLQGPLPNVIPPATRANSIPAAVATPDAVQDALDGAIRQGLAWMALSRQARPVNPPPMRPLVARDVPGELRPRQTPLDPTQRRALERLRWATAGKWVDFRTAPHTPAITLLRGRLLEPAAERPDPGLSLAETTARRFLRRNQDLLGLRDTDENLLLLAESTDPLGYAHLRFATRYRGLTVWPSALTVQTDPAGNVDLLTGAYAPTPDGLSITPGVPADQARTAARAAVGADPSSPVAAEQLLVYAPIESADARLAWRFDIPTAVTEHWLVFVDAQTAELLHVQNEVCTAHAAGSGLDTGGNTQPLNLWQHTDGAYYMVDTTKAMYNPAQSSPPEPDAVTGGIVVLRAPQAVVQNGQLQQLGPLFHSVSQSPTAGFSPHAVAASANLGRVYDYYLDRFTRNSINGQGGTLMAIVDIPNYFNAAWSSQTETMFYGTGANYAESLDVTAHEMTHGVISSTSDLVYRLQSGALNESFADILGEGCEAHFASLQPDWSQGSALPPVFRRPLDDPSSKIYNPETGEGYPERMSEYKNLPIEEDQGGVHVNSSIQNYAFYLLAEGLPGAIGIADALAIFYRAVTTKLNPNSQFIDSRLACVVSAEELFGAGSAHALRTAEAFDAVEVFDQGGSTGEAPIPTVTAADSTLFIFPSGLTMYLGRREAAFGDGPAGVFLGDQGQPTPVAPAKKPAVTGDGAFGIFVTPDFDGAIINTMTGEETFFDLPNQIESAAISGDGNVYAFVLRDNGLPGRRIYVYDALADTSAIYEATQPVVDQPNNGLTDTILRLDAIDLSPDGRFVYYDAVNRLALNFGGFIDSWSTYVLDRGAGRVFDLFPPIPGVNLGNPAIGQTRANLITFDVQDASGVHYIYATNRDSGQTQPVAVLSAGATVAPGWPGYSGNDGAVVYTDYYFDFGLLQYVPVLATIPVAADGMTPTGSNTAWLQGSNPNLGTIYRRGAWQGLPEVGVASMANAAEGGASGRFRLSRAAAGAAPLTVGFTLTGSARNGLDFEQVPLSATIESGATFADVLIHAVDDGAGEGAEAVTLTLSDFPDYQIVAREAVVSIADNDPVSGFAAWAADQGIPANEPFGNGDGDPWTYLQEYALGLDPHQEDGADALRVRVVEGRMIVDVTRVQRPDILYAVEVAPSLTGDPWVSGAPHTTVLTDSPSLLSVRSDAPTNTTGQFGRLRITLQ